MPTSAGGWLRTREFWRGLSAAQKVSFVKVTRHPPLDHSGGICHTHQKLWRQQTKARIVHGIVLAIRMLVNIYTVAALSVGVADALSTHDFMLYRGLTASIKLQSWFSHSGARVEFCFDYSDGEATTQRHNCIKRSAKFLWTAVVFVSISERLIISLGIIFVFGGLMVYVFMGYSSILPRVPGIYLHWPRYLATFSVVKLLKYCNPTIMKRVPIFMREAVWGERYVAKQHHRINSIFSLIFLLFLLFLAVCAIVVKITQFSWIAMQGPTDWTYKNYIKLAGFLNQLSAIVDVDGLEIDRLYLFRYGGADGEWQASEQQQVRDYEQLLLEDIAQGKFCRNLQGRFIGWMCMASLTSQDLQKLWFNDTEELKFADEVVLMERCYNPLYWPPRGSDPKYRRANKDAPGPHPLEEEGKADLDFDFRNTFFVENLQSYRKWLDKGKPGALKLYNGHGDLEEVTGEQTYVAELVVEPQRSLLSSCYEELTTGTEHSTRLLKMALWLQAQIEDMADMGTRSQDLGEKKTRDAIPSQAKKAPNAFARQLSNMSRRFIAAVSHTSAASLEVFLTAIQDAERWSRLDVSHEDDSYLEGRGDTLASACENARRNAEVLEVFAQLRDVQCNTKEDLCASMAALDLPQTLESARKVAHHKGVLLQEAREALAAVEALQKKASEGKDRAGSTELASLMERMKSNKVLTGNEEEVVELEKSFERVKSLQREVHPLLSFGRAHTIQLSQFQGSHHGMASQDGDGLDSPSTSGRRALYESEGDASPQWPKSPRVSKQTTSWEDRYSARSVG